jgi:hypothetical protein
MESCAFIGQKCTVRANAATITAVADTVENALGQMDSFIASFSSAATAVVAVALLKAAAATETAISAGAICAAWVASSPVIATVEMATRRLNRMRRSFSMARETLF